MQETKKWFYLSFPIFISHKKIPDKYLSCTISGKSSPKKNRTTQVQPLYLLNQNEDEKPKCQNLMFEK